MAHPSFPPSRTCLLVGTKAPLQSGDEAIFGTVGGDECFPSVQKYMVCTVQTGSWACSEPVLLDTGPLAMVLNPLGLCSLHRQPGRVTIVSSLLFMGLLLGSRGTWS